jgi:hypothetical protein
MNTQSTPTNYRSLTRYWPSIGFPKGGTFLYGCDAENNDVRPTVPVAEPETTLLFFCEDSSNIVTVNGKAAAPINGDADAEIYLDNVGDALELVALPDGTGWRASSNKRTFVT